MDRSTHDRLLLVATLVLVLVLSASVPNAVGATLPAGKLLEIEPSWTWAGIARVYLEIEDLRQTGEMLEGTYRIRVPLSPRRNDTGRLVLHASGSIDEPGNNLATVTGSALSSTGQVHEVVARMQPNGVVRIHVTTPQRKLRFKSRYALH